MKQSPTLKVALNFYYNPGVYALLLGSGVSKSAGIPTGWDIITDLVQKIAVLHSEKPVPNPEKWYIQKFGQPLNYSDLLSDLTKTSSERMSLLRSYFEPTPEEQEENLKTPTKAHNAIAALVKLGFIKIILTTNFDRLLEKALHDVGITPNIISSIDHLTGAMPYVHSKCTIIKLHGDYLDTRIKNTSEELEQYPEEINALLDRILDEFGLIICGWSATWDNALRAAILRCKCRRFGYYWLAKGPDLTNEAKDVVDARNADVIQILSADDFFQQLLENVESLNELEQSDPMDIKVLEATVKRYLSENKYRIRLHDLIITEGEFVYEQLQSDIFDCQNQRSLDQIHYRMHQHEELTLKLIKCLSSIAYFDNGENAYLLTSILERLSSQPRMGGNTVLLNLQYYSALLIEYSTGISAIAAGRYDNLASILLKPTYCERRNNEIRPLIGQLTTDSVFYEEKQFIPRPNAQNEYTPSNNYIYDILRPTLHEIIPSDEKYEYFFDFFEYLLSLIYMDLVKPGWTTIGCFGWRYNYGGLAKAPFMNFFIEGINQREEWELLKSGFFGGSITKFLTVFEKNQEFIATVTSHWG